MAEGVFDGGTHCAHHDRDKYLHVATGHLKRMLEGIYEDWSAKLKLSCSYSMQALGSKKADTWHYITSQHQKSPDDLSIKHREQPRESIERDA